MLLKINLPSAIEESVVILIASAASPVQYYGLNNIYFVETKIKIKMKSIRIKHKTPFFAVLTFVTISNIYLPWEDIVFLSIYRDTSYARHRQVDRRIPSCYRISVNYCNRERVIFSGIVEHRSSHWLDSTLAIRHRLCESVAVHNSSAIVPDAVHIYPDSGNDFVSLSMVLAPYHRPLLPTIRMATKRGKMNFDFQKLRVI